MGLENLLNNENMHDVIFLVGEKRTKIYGHKLILTSHNEFFNVMVSSSFSDSKKGQFVITDIEPEIYMEILRFMYCGTSNLSIDNFYPIYKAADKYLMADLKDFCIKFVDENIAIKILIENAAAGTAKFKELEEVCLNVICNNPLFFFDDEQFKEMSKTLLELVCSKIKISGMRYCSYNDMLAAIDNWADGNKEIATAKIDEINALKLSMNIESKMIRFDIRIREKFMTYSKKLSIKVLKPCVLFGLSILSYPYPLSDQTEMTLELYNSISNVKYMEVKYKFTQIKTSLLQYIKKIKLTSSDKLVISWCGFHCMPFYNLYQNEYFMLETENDMGTCIEYFLIEDLN